MGWMGLLCKGCGCRLVRPVGQGMRGTKARLGPIGEALLGGGWARFPCFVGFRGPFPDS